jgi:hypothetical protein
MRRIYAQIGLALMLVFAQQCAFAHLISHAARQSTQQETNHDPAKACAICLAAAHLGSAVGTAAPLPLARLALPAAPTMDHIVAHLSVVHAYRSRAPPTIR